MAPRDLYIVATDRKDLYALLRKQFADNANVEVIMDRRQGERRAAPGGATTEQRKTERRLDDEAYLLRTIGVILVPARRREGEARGAAAAPARKGRRAGKGGRR